MHSGLTMSDQQSDSNNELQYQGRTAKRADSRERRRAILEATLRIIIREGIRGVRHRAVAKEADVPLASTTYYFKDITDLIADALTLHAEMSQQHTNNLEQRSLAVLDQLPVSQLHEPEIRSQLIERLTNLLVDYVYEQSQNRDQRFLEHAFRSEAIRTTELSTAARLGQEPVYQTILKFLQLLGAKDPNASCFIVKGTVVELEYQLLLENPRLDKQCVQATIKHLICQNTQLKEE